MATAYFDAFKTGFKSVGRKDDDGFDRLSNRHSIGILIAAALLISTKSYVGDPIDCFEPQEFSDQWVKYMDNVCWVSNTYYVPIGDEIPSELDGLPEHLQYYQWVPIILAFQAFLFMIPTFIWDVCVKYGGYDVQSIVKSCQGSESINPETRDKTISYLVNQMTRYLQYRRTYKSGFSLGMGKRYGVFLYSSYLFVKVLYIANALGQIFFLSSILGEEYKTWGVEIVSDLINDRDWTHSPLFPRITLCSFKIRRLGENVHRYTVQCLLPVNLFNEKVFMVLWWWLIIVVALSIFGLLVWLLTATFPSAQTRFVDKYLILMNRRHGYHPDDVDDFANNFLRVDGVFSLRIIKKNTNDLVCGEIIATLWDFYTENRKLRSGEGGPSYLDGPDHVESKM